MESGLNIQIKMSALRSLRILGGYLGLLSVLSENYDSSEVSTKYWLTNWLDGWFIAMTKRLLKGKIYSSAQSFGNFLVF